MAALALIAFTGAMAQKMKVESGSFDFLKGEKEINISFDYDKVTFYKEEMTEQQYIDKRVADITQDKGKAEAEKWLKDWNTTKEGDFIDKFILSFNKNMDKPSMRMKQGSDAKYTVIVEAVWIYPGWFAGVMKQPAKVTTRLKFVETANPDKVLLTINSKNAPGDIAFVGVPNHNDRMAEGFAKTGKSLAKLMEKKIKK